MRYAIRFDEALGKELQRYCEGLVDDLVLELLRCRYDLDSGIHNARKLVKEIRAVLRLLKPLQSESHFDNWQLLKAIGDSTSHLRDRYVGHDLWKTLLPHLGAQADAAAVTQAMNVELTRELNSEHFQHSVVETVEHLQVLSTLMLQRKQTLLLPPPVLEVDKDWLAEQYGHLYRKLVKTSVEAKGVLEAEGRHEQRKRGKDLLYALRLCKPVWSGSLKNLSRKLSDHLEQLGKANDLAVLEPVVVAKATADPDGLRVWFSDQRKKIWQQVDDALLPLLSESETRFSHRVRKSLG